MLVLRLTVTFLPFLFEEKAFSSFQGSGFQMYTDTEVFIKC